LKWFKNPLFSVKGRARNGSAFFVITLLIRRFRKKVSLYLNEPPSISSSAPPRRFLDRPKGNGIHLLSFNSTHEGASLRDSVHHPSLDDFLDLGSVHAESEQEKGIALGELESGAFGGVDDGAHGRSSFHS
jgi:hypothetical protein